MARLKRKLTPKETDQVEAIRESLKGAAMPAALAGVLTPQQEMALGIRAMAIDARVGSAMLGSACARMGQSPEAARRAMEGTAPPHRP